MKDKRMKLPNPNAREFKKKNKLRPNVRESLPKKLLLRMLPKLNVNALLRKMKKQDLPKKLKRNKNVKDLQMKRPLLRRLPKLNVNALHRKKLMNQPALLPKKRLPELLPRKPPNKQKRRRLLVLPLKKRLLKLLPKKKLPAKQKKRPRFKQRRKRQPVLLQKPKPPLQKLRKRKTPTMINIHPSPANLTNQISPRNLINLINLTRRRRSPSKSPL